MGQVRVPPRVAPAAYRSVDPMAALALGAVLLGLGALFSGISDWQWEFDPSYWTGLAGNLSDLVLSAGTEFATGLLASLAQSAYASLTDSAPVLMAALLLAVFALGPNEIARTLMPRREG